MEESKDGKLLSGAKVIYSTAFHHKFSIICQMCYKKYTTKKTSGRTEIGIFSLKRAGDTSEDVIVKKSIQILEKEKKPLLYHNTNNCFKKFIHKVYIYSQVCTLWIRSVMGHNIKEVLVCNIQNIDFAVQFFLDDTKFFQDEVYSRIVDLTSVNLITAAALFYHEKCYGKYSWKYERARSGNDNVKNNVETKLTNRKEQLFHLAFCRT